MTTDPILTVRDNVRALMRARGWTQVDVAGHSGVAQRTVSDLLGYGERTDKAPTLRTIAALARAFGIPAWQLQAPLPVELLTSQRPAKLLEQFALVGEPGRESLERIAAVEVRIHSSQQPPAAPPGVQRAVARSRL